MPVISVLDPAVSELIAAGEVIERPASVIKELIENAIDAHATRITVEIKNGGTTFMRIVDDGDGMAREDVPTAFLRHATSKIAEKADLDTIMTLGFRGEALASVAAVARVTVMTKRREDDLGTRYEIAGVEQGEPEECGCPDGTSILVKDLFFNVPARRKFMKRDSAEGNAVAQIVQKIAISHPGIAFKFIRDNKLDFHSDGSGELLAAIRAVYGRDFAHDLIAVDHEQDGIHVKGYVVKPLYSKSSRSFQDFFVNTRYVRSRALSVALESAYENMVMTGKFPACVLLLDLPPDTLDVNIHPAKAEVRFTDEKGVINAVYFAVKNAMLQNGLIYEFQMPRRDWYAGAPAPTYEQQSLPAPPPAERPAYLPPVRETATPLEMPVEEMPQETAPVSSDMTQERAQETAPSSVPPRPQLDGGDMPFGMPAPRPRTEYADRSVPVSHFGDSKPPRAAIVQDSFVDMDAETDTQEFPAPPPPQAAPALRVADPYPDIKVLGELFANYILAQSGDTFIIIDKHAWVILHRIALAKTDKTTLLVMHFSVKLERSGRAVCARNADHLREIKPVVQVKLSIRSLAHIRCKQHVRSVRIVRILAVSDEEIGVIILGEGNIVIIHAVDAGTFGNLSTSVGEKAFQIFEGFRGRKSYARLRKGHDGVFLRRCGLFGACRLCCFRSGF